MTWTNLYQNHPRRLGKAEPDAGVGPQSELGKRVDAAISEYERRCRRIAALLNRKALRVIRGGGT